MDENDLRRLGFFCKAFCRYCKVELIVDNNWSRNQEVNQSKICKPCETIEREKWRKANPEKTKGYSYYSHRKLNRRFSCSIRRAKSKGIVWTLTKEEFSILITQPCHYCNHPLRETSTGLDQKKPKEGYTIDNVVPCCKECNTAKSNFFTYDEMLLIGKVIKEIKDKRKNISQENIKFS